MSSTKVLLSASKSISYSILVQFIFRIATFLVNAVIVRFITKDLLGLVHVRLMLLFNTVYLLTSEPFTRACFSRLDLTDNRVSSKTRSSWDRIINLLWLCIPIGLIWAAGCSFVWLYWLEWPSTSVTSSYKTAVFCYALAAVVELLAEPFKIVSQILLLVKVKPFIEGLSLVVETTVLVGCVIFYPSLGLYSFCISRLLYSLTVMVCYYGYFIRKIRRKNHLKDEPYKEITKTKSNDKSISGHHETLKHTDNLRDRKIISVPHYKNFHDHDDGIMTNGHEVQNVKDRTQNCDDNDDFPFLSVRDLLPKMIRFDDEVHSTNDTSQLLWSFSKQVVLKQAFSEGEKYIMTIFGILSLADQGVYSIVNNLGSMVVRMIFLPMEEGFYLFISKSLTRGCSAHLQNEESLKLVSRSLEVMLKIRMLLGVTVTTFGYSCAFIALDIVFGDRLSSEPGPVLLKWNCVYILLVSINGITEGFQNASMDKKQIDRYNHAMMGFSIAFLATSWFFTTYLRLGAVGFYLSNCCSMLLRISYSLIYARKYFRETPHKPITGLLLSAPVIVAYLVSFFVTSTSEIYLCQQRRVPQYCLHIVIVACSLFLVLVTVYKKERKLVDFIKEEYLHKRTEKVKLN